MDQVFSVGHIDRMDMTKHRAWQWTRGVVALFLAVLLAGAAISHNEFRAGNAAFIFAYMIAALASIYVSICRQWDFEIVGWVLLGVFFIGLTMA